MLRYSSPRRLLGDLPQPGFLGHPRLLPAGLTWLVGFKVQGLGFKVQGQGFRV